MGLALIVAAFLFQTAKLAKISDYLCRVKINIPPFLPTAIVVLAILWLTLVPHPLPEADIPLFEDADKAVHAIMFGGLAAVACYDCRRAFPGRLGIGRALVIALVAGAFGGVIELLQMAMNAGRSAETFDFVADAAGAFPCAVAAWWVLRRFD